MPQAQPTEYLADYDRRVNAGAVKADPGQRAAAEALDGLLGQLQGARKASTLTRILKGGKGSSGLYLWGEVGRGKSMLMDLFADHAKKTTKTRRVHFHAFMLDVHKRLHAFRQMSAGSEL